jgi:mRNA interferase HigB
MRLLTEQTIRQFVSEHPESKVAMQVWISVVKSSRWTCFADVKNDFNSVDAVGNQHYVFNIMGNRFRLVAVIKFTIRAVYVRFIGTHKEYDRIDCKTI